MAKTVSSKKAKGRRLELKVAQLLRTAGFPCYRTPLSGGGTIKGDIFCELHNPPMYWECKNQETLRIWAEWQKIRDQKNPVLVVSGNNRPILAICDIEMFIDLIKFFKKVKNL